MDAPISFQPQLTTIAALPAVQQVAGLRNTCLGCTGLGSAVVKMCHIRRALGTAVPVASPIWKTTIPLTQRSPYAHSTLDSNGCIYLVPWARAVQLDECN